MWIKRIISSLLGVRKKADLEKDLRQISLSKVIILFVLINSVFIFIIISITKILL